jgi:hypothetical protein
LAHGLATEAPTRASPNVITTKFLKKCNGVARFRLYPVPNTE